MIRFLDGFRAEMERTQAFVDRLRELELLAQRNFQVKDGLGRRFLLRDFRVVDEEKLAKLEDAVLGELHRAGYLGWIYAHLISLGNITRLPAQIPVEQATPAEAKEADAAVEQAAASEADEERRETRAEG